MHMLRIFRKYLNFMVSGSFFCSVITFYLFTNVAIGSDDKNVLGRRNTLRAGIGALVGVAGRTAPVAADVSTAHLARIATLEGQLAQQAALIQQLTTNAVDAMGVVGQYVNRGRESFTREGLLAKMDSLSRQNNMANPLFVDEDLLIGPHYRPYLGSWAHGYLNYFWENYDGGSPHKLAEVISDWVVQRPNEAAPVLSEANELISGLKSSSMSIADIMYSSKTQQLAYFRLAKLLHKVSDAVKSAPWSGFDWNNVFADRIAQALFKLAPVHRFPINMIASVIQLFGAPSTDRIAGIPVQSANYFFTNAFIIALAEEVRAFAPLTAANFLQSYTFDRALFDEKFKVFMTQPKITDRIVYDEFTGHSRVLKPDSVDAFMRRLRYKFNSALHISRNENVVSISSLEAPRHLYNMMPGVSGGTLADTFQKMFADDDQVSFAVWPIDIAYTHLKSALDTLNSILSDLRELPDTDIRYASLAMGEFVRDQLIFEIRTLPQKHRAYYKALPLFQRAWRENLPVPTLPASNSHEWLTIGAATPQDKILDKQWLEFLLQQGTQFYDQLQNLESRLAASVQLVDAVAAAVPADIKVTATPLSRMDSSETVAPPMDMTQFMQNLTILDCQSVFQ